VSTQIIKNDVFVIASAEREIEVFLSADPMKNPN
jgi:hypothetical protein